MIKKYTLFIFTFLFGLATLPAYPMIDYLAEWGVKRRLKMSDNEYDFIHAHHNYKIRKLKMDNGKIAETESLGNNPQTFHSLHIPLRLLRQNSALNLGNVITECVTAGHLEGNPERVLIEVFEPCEQPWYKELFVPLCASIPAVALTLLFKQKKITEATTKPKLSSPSLFGIGLSIAAGIWGETYLLKKHHSCGFFIIGRLSA
jgi:hypothetical protein